jgi:hypothetical protein
MTPRERLSGLVAGAIANLNEGCVVMAGSDYGRLHPDRARRVLKALVRSVLLEVEDAVLAAEDIGEVIERVRALNPMRCRVCGGAVPAPFNLYCCGEHQEQGNAEGGRP